MKKFIALIMILISCFLLSADSEASEIVRQKNAATYVVFPIVKNDGTLITSAAGLDSEIDVFADGTAPDGFADCTNEATEIGSTGQYYLSLTQSEMNNDYIIIQAKSTTTDAMVQTLLIRTQVGDPLLLATTDDGGTINVTSGKVDEVATLTGHTAQTGDAYARLGAPAGASVSADVAAVKSDSAAILVDTAAMDTANELRTLLTGGTSALSILTTSDNIGINWGDISNPTTTVNLSGTTVGTVTALTTWDKSGYALSAAGIDAIWDEVQSGHATAGSFGLYLNAPVATIDTVVDAIKEKTDNLPSDPADASVVAGLIATVQADLDNPSQYKADVSGLSTFDPATDEVDIGSVKGVGVTDIDDFKDGATTTVY